MASSSATWHEPYELLTAPTKDMHRAVVSLMEELEALDWYAQRAEGATDGDLRAVLGHNGDEEKEHAAMLLEWIRRHDPVFDRHLRTYLFSTGPILAIEEGGGAGARDAPSAGGPRTRLGSLKEEGR